MKLDIRTIIAGGALAAIAAFAFAAPATENWENHCAKCHGADGKGQTKAGRQLNVRDYTDPKVQADMKDAEMIKATANGVTGTAGRYQECSAAADSREVSPHVGTHPHQ